MWILELSDEIKWSLFNNVGLEEDGSKMDVFHAIIVLVWNSDGVGNFMAMGKSLLTAGVFVESWPFVSVDNN